MKILGLLTGGLLVISLITGCSVMSQNIQDEALPSLPFKDLINHADQYKGQTAILGGYVVSVENLKQGSRMVAVQAPLGVGERPKSKDLSQGRLILTFKGFIDPEVFTRDRQITVGGSITGSSADNPGATFPYLAVQVEEMHLWPVEKPLPPDPFWYDDYWYSPYPWWGRPYWHHHR